MKSPGQVPSDPTGRDPNTGSPPPGEPVFLAVGKLRRPHGIHGEILMDVLTDFPERLMAEKTVYLGDEHRPLRITYLRSQDRAILISFEGYEDSDQAGTLRNQIVYVRSDALPDLPAGEYYHHQLLGLKVIGEDGTDLGFLSEILETGANDVYLVVSPEGQETLLPAIESVILGVDLETRMMRVRLQEWD